MTSAQELGAGVVGGPSSAEGKFSSSELRALFNYRADATCDTLRLLLSRHGRLDELAGRANISRWVPDLSQSVVVVRSFYTTEHRLKRPSPGGCRVLASQSVAHRPYHGA